MAQFDETLNQILSNPAAMAQIAQLAQSLGPVSTPSDHPSESPASGQNHPTFRQNPPASGENHAPSPNHSTVNPPPNHPTTAAPPSNGPPPAAPPSNQPDPVPLSNHTPEHDPDPSGGENRMPMVSELSGILSGSPTLARLIPMVRELSTQRDSDARRLLYALRPYLKPHRQEKIERALQLAKICHIGKQFLLEWGNQDV